MTKHFRLTTKSQVTIPKDVRDMLDVKPGGLVAFVREGDKVFLRKAEEAKTMSFAERLKRARASAKPIPMEMTTDEYMAMMREPVPLDPDI